MTIRNPVGKLICVPVDPGTIIGLCVKRSTSTDRLHVEGIDILTLLVGEDLWEVFDSEQLRAIKT